MVFRLHQVGVEIGGRSILQDLSFSVAPGERITLLGVNGCGKSTLLKLLDGLIFTTTGTVHYKNEMLDAKALGNSEFRGRFRRDVALLFQNVDAMLFNPTVADEIAFGPRQLRTPDVEKRIERWSTIFNLADLMDRPPFELSGGEKKRVAMAAILAMEPKVLLLDEPASGLDPAWSAHLVDFLARMPEVTVIVSTHNLSLVEELGDRAILLAPNRAGLLYDGPPANLLANDALLMESGLAHRHSHRHEDEHHSHFHLHNGD
jgi:cobalt/nickel transport system ATP-binding protein